MTIDEIASFFTQCGPSSRATLICVILQSLHSVEKGRGQWLAETERNVINSGYAEMNDIDWGYVV